MFFFVVVILSLLFTYLLNKISDFFFKRIIFFILIVLVDLYVICITIYFFPTWPNDTDLTGSWTETLQITIDISYLDALTLDFCLFGDGCREDI